MSNELLALIERAKTVIMTPEECETQRISFAYGNARLENDQITRETVQKASEELKSTSNGTTVLQ